MPHPEAMMVLGSERAIVVSEGADDFNVIDLASITELSPLYPSSSARSDDES